VDASRLPPADPHVERLAALFRAHPAWRNAASRIAEGSASNVWFSHRPREPWHLERRGGETLLLAGAVADPDFVFRFTPAAIQRLGAVTGGMGAFAVALFESMLSEDEESRVGFRLVAPFHRLVWRGYLRLLLDAGPAVLRFGAANGIASVGALRRLASELRSKPPEEWER
jgi:hypothetical protein